ncbi:glycosyl hydrolase family 18 protein [Lentisphaerota bacterium WC36G]|nr:hypothetical protein LJT99_00600 [Lentisphaerae bacterium WC36]
MKKIIKSLTRITVVLGIIFAIFGIIYWIMPSGKLFTDGRFDLRQNGIWLQHGWLGDDIWFKRNNRDKTKFRSEQKITELFTKMKKHSIKFLYPHLCPTFFDGKISKVDDIQTKLFLKLAKKNELNILPWIGGVFDDSVKLSSEKWRKNFTESILRLLNEYSEFDGIQINIEPLPNGNKDFILLLKELHDVFPKDKIISIAAYPPPTILHPHENVHWDMQYYSEIAPYVDQMAVMMYDTAIKFPKLYVSLMSSWTKELLNNKTLKKFNVKILLGLPAYDDAYTTYHEPEVENINYALKGINLGLSSFKELPKNYQGTVIYCEWEMNNSKWQIFYENFQKK